MSDKKMNISDIHAAMDYKSLEELSRFLINKNGGFFQSFINIEENAELITELLSGKKTKNTDSEIADVFLTISHVITFLEIQNKHMENLQSDLKKRIDTIKLCIHLSQLIKETAKNINRDKSNLDEIAKYTSLVTAGLLKYIQNNNNLESVKKQIEYKIKRTKERNNYTEYNFEFHKKRDWDQIFLLMAFSIASGSHCVSRQVGALVVKNKRIISTGINGTPEGCKNCDDIFPARTDPKFNRTEHHKFSSKNEIHAEMNAVIFDAKNGGYSIDGATLYCTTQPCDDCLKNILQSGIVRIVYAESYDLSDYSDFILDAIKSKGIELVHKPLLNTSKAFVFLQNSMVKTKQ